MKNILITTEDQKLIEFFQKDIERKNLALYIRRAIYIMSKVSLDKNNDDEGCVYISPEWLEKGFYWLNEFAETIDPYLEKEIN